MGPRATQYHGTSNETTMSYDQNSEPELAECHAPDNQLGLNYFRQQSSQHQQPHIQPGPSTEMNFRQQSNGHGGRGGGTLQQQLNLPGPSSGKNLRQLQDTNFFDAAETQAFPAEACNGNKRPQLSQKPRHTASEVSTQDSFVGRSSNKEILRQPRNLNEIPNAVFQDYVKRSLEFLKIHCREMSAKIDDLLESRPKPCICTIQRMEDNEEQFNLPMESFAAVEDMEKTMGDQQTRQQMILILLRLGGVSLQKTVYSIMEKLFTCEIGMHYTWTGKSTKEFEKEKFSDLKNIYAAICGAVLGNKDLSSDEKTSVKIQFQVTEWLRHCRQNVIKRRISF
ncbi:uncharacterized protein LOC123475809 [Daphnia magna]|uniref:uncharacterized protein LOC123475809 n=1 Tax=Daphnia magna TaxID=35525 RepID=UPI001E1BA573|nr:uncharacterized protein LOC123475809 [Daphnia magna]